MSITSKRERWKKLQRQARAEEQAEAGGEHHDLGRSVAAVQQQCQQRQRTRKQQRQLGELRGPSRPGGRGGRRGTAAAAAGETDPLLAVDEERLDALLGKMPSSRVILERHSPVGSSVRSHRSGSVPGGGGRMGLAAARLGAGLGTGSVGEALGREMAEGMLRGQDGDASGNRDRPFEAEEPGPEVLYFKPKPVVQPKAPLCVDVAIIGTPNSGKSVLTNLLVNSPVSAVSPKSHTTRKKTVGVYTDGDVQVVLLDTPGIVGEKDTKKFLQSLVQQAWKGAMQADVIVIVIDAAKRLSLLERELLLKIPDIKAKNPDVALTLCLNKVDRVSPKKRLLELAEMLNEQYYEFDETFMTSGLKNTGIQPIREFFLENAKPRPWLFSRDEATDQSQVERVTELVREKLYRRTNQEIPHTVTIVTNGWTELGDGTLRIDMSLVTAHKRHQPILVGSGASVISAIRDDAKRDIEQLLDRKVHLYLTVSSDPSKPRANR